ncbi:ABC transporter permease [Nocardioides sp. CBS4Y-1]|uniref:ABC transporter permease n=2 Tax=Nocardioides acrostichi TaxID=2784339 RepID=A0A930UW37_9ACTN|nr:ABC transporter permease [Nocardioides acrostichi]
MLRLEARRVLRDPITLLFTVALPGFMFLVFGSSQDYAGDAVGNGNVAMAIMIAMAGYGAVTATVGLGASAAVERSHGWGRQLGMTPQRDIGYAAVKASLAVLVALLPALVVFALGLLTGAEGAVRAWALSFVVVAAGAVVFALYGLCFGLRFPSEGAATAASLSVVLLSFLGNIFFPLSGALLTIAKFTPLYGYVALARYPLTEGWVITGGDLVHESLWVPLTNVVAWTAVLAVAATLLVRRSRARQ